MRDRLPHPRFWGAYLFVPGNRAGFITRLPVLPVQSVILDLEYATRWPHKAEARHLVAGAIGYLRELRPELNITVRINMPTAGLLAERDLDLLVPARPDAIRIPAVEDAAAVARLDAHVAELERRHGLPEGDIRFHPMIENPRGLANASAIAAASARNEALCLGGEDWAQNSGLTRTRASRELDSVRTAVVTTAVAHGLVPIDSVYPWLDDLEGLADDCRFSRGIGFRGRASTNPRQLAVIQSIYRPDDESLSKARRVLDQLATLEVDGASIYLVDGVITDPAAVFQARLTCLSAGDPR